MSGPVSNSMLQRWLAAAVILAVLLAVWLILRRLVSPIAWSMVLAFLMHPLQRRLTRKLGNRPSAAAGILTALTPIAIFVPLSLLALAFAQQVASLTASVEGGNSLFDAARWIDPEAHPRIAGAVAWVAERFDLRLADLQQHLRQGVRDSMGVIAKSSGAVVLGTAGALLRFFVMLFILFFMLRDGASWFARAVTLIPLERRRRYALLSRLGKVLRAVVYGCGLTALVQGTLVGIGFAIAGLPGFVVFGVLAAVCGLLPFGGAALVWAPAVLYLAAMGKFGWAVFMLVWGGIVSTSDNFIRPVIISRYTPVPTLLVFLGVIGGVGAFGLMGFIVGPVILVLAVELFNFAEGSMARSR
ncbi:MAG: AI-2E family transporter [Pseudomonadota bacterium]|jgi:predicted PurR-regulated permease PerM|nr:MAG: AI-2E family transporter [Pseudomonadota bacterium]